MQSLDEQHLDEVLKGITIPSCPAVLTQLMNELRKPMANSKNVAQLIGKDVGLAAIVIKSANSPLFGGRRQIGSIADAIKLIGFGSLTNLVYEGLLRSAIRVPDASLERFWDNSAHAAALCAELASRLGGASRDAAFTFGLFHDCGIPMLVQRFPDYKTVLREANLSLDRSFTAIEDAALSTNHAVVGYLMAKAWGLPASVAEGILCHHDYGVLLDANGLADESRALIAISALADHISGRYLRAQQDCEWHKAEHAVSHYYGRSPQEIGDLVDDLLFRLDENANTRDRNGAD